MNETRATPVRAFPQLLRKLLQSETRGGGLLLFTGALLGFALANSPWQEGYVALKALPLSISLGSWQLAEPLVGWVNDLLMAGFFLLVGLELKRELLQGELADPRRAALSVSAALGGMLVPAALYTVVNWGGAGGRGWGVPMATDIAFALGVLSLLGRRVPLGLKVFLTALAIVDDLGAVLVIALFYSRELDPGALAFAFGFLALALLAGRLGVRNLTVYLGLGLALWFFVLESGLDAAISGVLLALAVPLRPLAPTKSKSGPSARGAALEPEAQAARALPQRAQSPLRRLEHHLSPWVAYLVLPLFAFFNAGVGVAGSALGPVGLGVFVGLVLGKPSGILLVSWLAVRGGLATLPVGVNWRMLAGVSVLGGIGFTVALFITELAFSSPALLAEAKLGVLAASLLAAALGLWLLAGATAQRPGG